jgi:hypothetical protein
MVYSTVYYLTKAIEQLQGNLELIEERIKNETRKPDEIDYCGKLEILFDDYGNVTRIYFYGLVNEFDKISVSQ